MEDTFRALVVDDEAPARSELAYLLRSSPRISEVLEAEDAGHCLDLLSREPVDVVFLDIRMPGLDGLQLAGLVSRLGPQLPVVFVTAFEEHAVEAFQLAAFDYLLKPVRQDRLQLTIERLALSTHGATSPEPGEQGHDRPPLDDRLAVTHRGQILMLRVEEIRVAEVAGDRVALITPEGRYLARLRLSELEARMTRLSFMRVHRHYIVNLHHVASVESFFNGTYLLRLQDLPELAVPVSRRHGPELRAALGI